MAYRLAYRFKGEAHSTQRVINREPDALRAYQAIATLPNVPWARLIDGSGETVVQKGKD